MYIAISHATSFANSPTIALTPAPFLVQICLHNCKQGCTGKEPTVVGKPSPLMIDYMVEKFGVQRERICMVSFMVL